VRSQALSALYRAVRRGDLDSVTARERLLRINSLKVRFLGDKVLQQTAWRSRTSWAGTTRRTRSTSR
jgi:indolepyruvate ferredoxin oxidoreductase alpha subunit